MNFKVSDDPLFQDKWQHLMHTNERFLSALHESTDNSINIGTAVTALRVSINSLMELIPVKAHVRMHVSLLADFKAEATRAGVQVTGTVNVGDRVDVAMFAPRHKILNATGVFRLHPVHLEKLSWTYL